MCLIPTALAAALAVEIAALAWAAWTDLAGRLIPNSVCLVVALCGAGTRIAAGPRAFATSVAVAAVLLCLLLILHAGRAIGGGDVKLLVAAALGQSLTGTVRLLAIMALAGGVLAFAHLAMRHLPRPALAPAGSSALRRVYAAERWRIKRGAPLPYGVAIAFGGILTLLTYTGG